MTTVRMIRAEDGKTGDIHPDEVEHMKAHGWMVVAEDPPQVEIPTDWEGLHWKHRVALARQLGAGDDVTADEAREIIAAEVARRAED